MELHLAALHRQEYVVAAAIADDHPVLHAQHLQGELRQEAGNVGLVERTDDDVFAFMSRAAP